MCTSLTVTEYLPVIYWFRNFNRSLTKLTFSYPRRSGCLRSSDLLVLYLRSSLGGLCFPRSTGDRDPVVSISCSSASSDIALSGLNVSSLTTGLDDLLAVDLSLAGVKNSVELSTDSTLPSVGEFCVRGVTAWKLGLEEFSSI